VVREGEEGRALQLGGGELSNSVERPAAAMDGRCPGSTPSIVLKDKKYNTTRFLKNQIMEKLKKLS
jgi:hypothetical protein